MRIISGRYKGKIIHAPAKLPVRPTTDFAKTALFNILHNYFNFEEVAVLDLFCGTGNISYEFVSRGCTAIMSVDQDTRCLKFVRETMDKLEASGTQVIKSDVFKFVAAVPGKYDIIFADPPFDLEETDRLPELVREKSLLKENGWLIIEHQSKRKLVSNWLPAEVRTYGNCAFSIYKKE